VADDIYLGTKAAADLIGISDETLRRWVERRQIRFIRLPSGRLRFRREDIEAVHQNVTEPSEAAS
jgi:excisionase family DNA binding protein